MDSSTIVSYINLGLTGLFIVIMIGLVIAALIGFKKGVFKSSFILLWMVTLICVLVLCLNPLLKVVELIPLNFLPIKAFTLTRTDVTPADTFVVPVTNIHDTLASFIEGIYMLYNIGGTSSAAQALAMSLSSTILKYVLFFILMIVIVIAGNIFGEILWNACFKNVIPKAFRTMFKGRAGGAVVYSIKYLLVTVMFLSPLTALANTINQSYQRNKTDDTQVSEIGTFLDAYNSSVFANVFFNWSVNNDGLTFDAALLDSVTSATVDGATISLIGEIKNFSDVATTVFNGVTGIGTESMVIDYSVLLSTDSVNTIFNALSGSNLVTLLLPVAAQIAVNSSFLEGSIDLSMLQVSDIDWKSEITYMQEMSNAILDTGILEGLLDENGKLVKIGIPEIKNTIKKIFSDSKEGDKNSPFESMLSVFQNAEKSKLFNRAISSVLGLAMQNDTEGNLTKYINLGWDEINDISWGYESYVLLDSIHTLYAIDDQFVDAIFATTSSSSSETGSEEPVVEGLRKEGDPATEDDAEKEETIIDLILKHVTNPQDFAQIKRAFIGDVNDSSSYDANGRSKVLDKGKRIEGRAYCLLDMSIFRSVAIPLLADLPNQEVIKANVDVTDDDLDYYHDMIDDLNEGVWLLNYKNEFGNLLDIVGIAGENETLANSVKNNFKDFIKDNDPFTISSDVIPTVQKILKTVDKSNLLYSFATIFIKGWLNKPGNADSFSQFGVDISVIDAGIRQDMKASNHELFHEVAGLLDCWGDFKALTSTISDAAGDSNKIINAFKDSSLCNSVAKIINKIVDLKFFNPDPQPGDTFEKNENLYAILEYVFSQAGNIGITVTRDDLKKVETNGHSWTNKYDASGNPVVNSSDGKYGEIYYVMEVLKFIASKDYTTALDLDMKSTSVLRKFANSGEDNYDLPGLLAKIDESKLFASVAGGFIDSAISSTGLLTTTESIRLSFDNVESWAEEGVKLGELLNALADLLDEYGSDFMDNFDLSKVDNIPLLNTVLHKLASSDIFKQREDNGDYTYLFGKWLYTKTKSALTSFNLDGNKDLVKDPDNWNTDWGYRPQDGGASTDKYFAEYYESFATEEEKAGTSNSYYLTYRDFVSINGSDPTNGMTAWCDSETFDSLNSSFTIDASWKSDNSYGALYGSEAFITAYNEIFEADEIGRLCKVLTYVLRLTNMSSFSLENLPGSLITDLLGSMNNSTCLQMAVYNFYDVAISLFANNDTAKSFIDLSTANADYMVSTGLTYDQRSQIRLNRAEEISHLSSLLNAFQDVNSSGIASSGTLDVTSLDASLITTFKSALKELNESYVFHRGGTETGNTVFQSVLLKILSNNLLSSYLYINDSPKDQALKTEYANFSSKSWDAMTIEEKANAKVLYILNSNFKTLPELTSLTEAEKASEFAAQADEIDAIFNSFEAILGMNGHIGLIGPGGNLSSVDINTVKSEAVSDVLTTLNASNTLYDLVPNFISKTFANFTANEAIGGINFGDVSAFYHYNYNGTVTTDYTNRYESETITNIASIIDDYQDLNTIVGSGSLTNKTTLNSLINDGVLGNLLSDIHDSYPMHKWNKYNVDGETHLTVFEQVVKELMDKATLTEKAYDSTKDIGFTKDTKLAAQIKAISKAENDGTTIASNYASNWNKLTGETKNILDLFKTVIDNIGGDSVDVNSISISSLSPAKVKSLLAAINKVDIVSDAVPSFVKSSFESMGLDGLTTFSGTSYAYYSLGRKVYGGNDGLAGDNTEIGLIVAALDNLYDESKSGNKYADLTNINSICSTVTNLDGVMKFISNSHILNTDIASGTYNQLNEVSTGVEISARGVIMYNLLGGSSDSNFLRYVTGSTNPQKVHALSSIFNVAGYDYIAESRGLYGVIKQSSELDASTSFDPSDYSKVKAKGAVITGLMETAYNAYNSKRSYFASEIMSNVLDEAVASERTRITSLGLTYGNASFKFGAANYNGIDKDSYNSLNATEKVGLQGIFDLLDVVTRITSGDVSVTRSDIVTAFTKMEGAEIARIYYLSRAHKRASSSDSFVLDFTQQDAMIILHGSKWSDYTSDVYNASFSFASYGDSLATFLGLA